jgi:transposase
MRLKELSVKLRDRIVSWHRSGEGYQNISAPLKVPKNTVASIILQWRKTTNTLPRAGCPAKLSNQGRSALVRDVTKDSMLTLTEFLCGDGGTFQKNTHLCNTPPIRSLW